MLRKYIIRCIDCYQKTYSLDHAHGISFCRFTPSCSQYAKECFERYGVVYALLRSMWRIIRCNPFSKGGKDLP